MSRFVRAAVAARPVAVALPDARDIVLLLGQSNMVGRGTLDAGIDTASDLVEQWSKVSQTIITSDDPLQHPDPLTAGAGPGMSFAKAYAAARTRRVLLVPAAYGGTSLVGGTPTWNLGGRDRENAITQCNAAVAAAVALYPGSAVKALLIIQGESDADAGVTQSTYQAALWGLIQDMRDRITGAANAPIVIGQMLPEAIAANVVFSTGAAGATYPAIDAAHTDMAARLFRCSKVAIGTGYAKPESPAVVHYNAAGGRAMGAAMYTGLAVAEAAAGEAVPAAVLLTAGISGINSQALSWAYPASGNWMDFVVEYKASAGSTWTVYGSVSGVTTTATVSGLTSGVSYDYRVRPRGYGGSGAYSNVATSSTVANTTTAIRLTQIQPTATPKLTESVNSSGEYLYTIPAGTSAPTQATDRAGISSHKLPANTAGGFILEIGSPHFTNGTANYSSVMFGLLKTNANTAAWNTGAVTGVIWGMVHHAATGNTWRMVSAGGVSTLAANSPLVAAAGDRIKIERNTIGEFRAYIARAAAPDTWTEYYTFPAGTNHTGEVFVSLAGSSAGTAPARTHGPVRGINVVAV